MHYHGIVSGPTLLIGCGCDEESESKTKTSSASFHLFPKTGIGFATFRKRKGDGCEKSKLTVYGSADFLLHILPI